MTQPALPSKYLELQRLLGAGDLTGARAALQQLRGGTETEDAPLVELFDIQLSVLSKDIEAGMGLSRIVSVMRRLPNLPYAKDLYQQISKLAYSGGQSSLSHSHPPPPITSDQD